MPARIGSFGFRWAAEREAIAAALEAIDAVRATRAPLGQASDPQFSGFASQLEAIDAIGVTIAAEGVPIAAQEARIAANRATIGGARRGDRRASRSDRRSPSNYRRGTRGDRGRRCDDRGQSVRRGKRMSQAAARSSWRLRRSARVERQSTRRAPTIEARSAAILETIAAQSGICGALASFFEAPVRPSEAQRTRRGKLAVICGSRGAGSGSIGCERRAPWGLSEPRAGERAALEAISVAPRRGRGVIGVPREALATRERAFATHDCAQAPRHTVQTEPAPITARYAARTSSVTVR